MKKLSLFQEVIAPMPRIYVGTDSTCSTEDCEPMPRYTSQYSCQGCSRIACQTEYTCNEPTPDRGR